MPEYNYKCNFCGANFVHEGRFMKHRCKQMIRDEEFRTPQGQAAWSFYQKWMKAYRRMVPNSKSFLHSKFYNSFMRFANFTKKVNLPDIDLFIKLMKQKDISPTIWTNDQVYAIYLEFIDRKAPPMTQASITVRTLLDLADEYECDPANIFDHMTPSEVIHLLRERRLSPWILLNSTKFKRFFVEKLSTEEKIVMESIIRPPYWKEKFGTNSADVEQMKLFVKELNL